MTEQEEARILREYFGETQRRSVEREFEQIAREWPVGLTPAEMEQLLLRGIR